MTASPPPTRHVVLVGLMASGKTTIGYLLARRLGLPFVDNDELLAMQTGSSAREIAAAEGAGGLHRREAEALVGALADPRPSVVAAAASTIDEPAAVAALRMHDVVYLRAAPEVLATRLSRGHDDGHRPFVEHDATQVVQSQFAARDLRYRELASITVDEGRKPPEAIAEQISRVLAE